MASWRYVLANVNGVSIGELRAEGRTFSGGVCTTCTATCVIHDSDPLWTTLSPGLSRLKVYDPLGNLRLFGPIISDEETASGDGATVKITAADLSWELGKRFVGRDSNGVGLTYTGKATSFIAADALAKTNVDFPTGITQGTQDSTITLPIQTFLWKRVLDILTELSSLDGSFEWKISYVDAALGAKPTVHLDLEYPMTGTDKTATVFLEYGPGTKGNCSGYSRVRATDVQATLVFGLGAGSTLVDHAQDLAAQTTYQCQREDVLAFGDIQQDVLLAALASAHVKVRKDPRTLISLTAFPGNAPVFGVDYGFGTRVTCRVVINGQVRVNGSVRIWGFDIAIDEAGNEVPTFRLTPS